LAGKYKTISEVMKDLNDPMLDRFDALREYLMALGDDVQQTTLVGVRAAILLRHRAMLRQHRLGRQSQLPRR